MNYMVTHGHVRLAARTGVTGFVALSGLDGWNTAPSFAGELGPMTTLAWRCTG